MRELRREADRGDTAAASPGDTLANPAPSSLGGRLFRRAEQRIQGQSNEEITSFVLSGFRRYLPNMVFAMLPVFALIFYLLYFRSRRFYAEHLIFAFHFHAFVFAALTVMAFLPEALQNASLLVVGVYLFMAMRRVYGESRRRTAVKLAAAMATCGFALVLASFFVMAGVFLMG